MPETFRRDLAGNQSCPVEPGQQPEARRASAGGNPAGEAKTASAQDQGASKQADLRTPGHLGAVGGKSGASMSWLWCIVVAIGLKHFLSNQDFGLGVFSVFAGLVSPPAGFASAPLDAGVDSFLAASLYLSLR